MLDLCQRSGDPRRFTRTAVAESSGGRTQVTGLVTAATIAAVLLFFTGPLQYVPNAALGALLIFASHSLFDTNTLREFWRIDRIEVGLAIVTTLGVVAFGAINGILIAVGLALARFIQMTARRRTRSSAPSKACRDCIRSTAIPKPGPFRDWCSIVSTRR